MRPRNVDRDLAKWLERLTVDAKVAIVLGSIPASSDTVESEGRQKKQCWITYITRKPKNSPVKKIGSFSFSFDVFASFCLFPFVFASDFFLVKKFVGLFSFHFDFFASFRLFHVRFRFRFLLFCFYVNQAKSYFFPLPSEMKFSLRFQFSLPKRKRGRTLVYTDRYPAFKHNFGSESRSWAQNASFFKKLKSSLIFV